MATTSSFFGSARFSASDKITLCPSNPAFSESTSLDKFMIHGNQYTRESAFASLRRAREQRSPIWRFAEALVRVENGAEVYYCWTCECEKRQ
jgi:hypothetical protein